MRPSALIVSRGLAPLKKHEARVVDMTSLSRIRIQCNTLFVQLAPFVLRKGEYILLKFFP